jgi:hypothetical protein
VTAPDLRLSLRFAVRELRGGLRGFGFSSKAGIGLR